MPDRRHALNALSQSRPSKRPGSERYRRVLLAASVLVLGCGVEPASAPDAPDERGRAQRVTSAQAGRAPSHVGPGRRIVLIQLDGLRADHTSAYGYARATTPALEALAAGGVRFDNARSVAPWTLPALRSLLTGHDPERFDRVETLQRQLSRAGWTTAMFAASASEDFGPKSALALDGLVKDWSEYDAASQSSAKDVIDRALAWLAAQPMREIFLFVHLSDLALPYREPESHRRLFAGDAPAALASLASLSAEAAADQTLLGAAAQAPADRQYLRDRYDNNVRYADDQLARLYAALARDDIVIFVSGHGQEFWEHGAFGHGHTLYDELLQVPLVIRAAGFAGIAAGGVVTAPVSLLDLAPTILDLAGLDADSAKGVSLLRAVRLEEAFLGALHGRDLAFGRLLHGREAWGLVAGHRKYRVSLAGEALFDLAHDPGELHDRSAVDPAPLPALRERLGRALDRDVVSAFHIAPRAARSGREPSAEALHIALSVPGGVRAAWVGEDAAAERGLRRRVPRDAPSVEVSPDGTLVHARWPALDSSGRGVWVVPTLPVASLTHRLRIEAEVGTARTLHRVAETSRPAPGPADWTLLDERTGTRGWTLAFGVTPLPLPAAR